MDDNFDVDKFASLVKSKESIWNYKSKSYANKQLRRDDWTAVCEAMVPDFGEKTKAERGAIVLEFQTKWRVLRDGFTRSIKNYNKKLGSGGKGKLYLYYEQLHFLHDLYNTKGLAWQNTEINSPPLKPEKYRKRQRSSTAEISDEPVEEIIPEKRVVEKASTSNKLPEYNEEQAPEEDKQFLLSLLGDFRKIPDDQKLDAKGDIINVIRHYRNTSAHYETRECYYTNDIAALATTATESYYEQSVEDCSRESSPIEIKTDEMIHLGGARGLYALVFQLLLIYLLCST